MDDRGRHLERSILLLSRTLTPALLDGVDRICEGVVGGDVDFLGSKDDAREVGAVEVFEVRLYQPNGSSSVPLETLIPLLEGVCRVP